MVRYDFKTRPATHGWVWARKVDVHDAILRMAGHDKPTARQRWTIECAMKGKYEDKQGEYLLPPDEIGSTVHFARVMGPHLDQESRRALPHIIHALEEFWRSHREGV